MKYIISIIIFSSIAVSCTTLSPYTHKFNGPGWEEIKAAKELSVYIDSVQAAENDNKLLIKLQ